MTQTTKKQTQKSPYADANVLICKAVGRVLLEYNKAERKGEFEFIHSKEEMAEVRNLITDYQILVYSNFSEKQKMADWLGRVAKMIPSLYD